MKNLKKIICFIFIIDSKVLILFYRKEVVRRVKKLNPLNNTRAMLKLNPYAAVLKRSAILTAQRRQREKEICLAEKRKVSNNSFAY